MRVRSITLFLHPPGSAHQLPYLADEIRAVPRKLEAHHLAVDSLRVATTPFSTWLNLTREAETTRAVQELEEAGRQAGMNYLSIGQASIASSGSIELIPKILGETQMIFCSSRLIDRKGRISFEAIRRATRVNLANSILDPDGFANLRYTTLAQVTPGCPFFPEQLLVGISRQLLWQWKEPIWPCARFKFLPA